MNHLNQHIHSFSIMIADKFSYQYLFYPCVMYVFSPCTVSKVAVGHAVSSICLRLACWYFINPLNAKLNPICHLLALLGGANIVVVSRLRVNGLCKIKQPVYKSITAITSQMPFILKPLSAF